MRKDYKYIEKAIDLIMCITTIGSDYIDELYNDDSKIDAAEGLDELLLYLEDSYLILKNGSTLGDWVDKINEDFADNYHSENTLITKEHILEGIKNGWIGFKTVIWDEGVQLKEEEEQVIFRITIPRKIFDMIKSLIIPKPKTDIETLTNSLTGFRNAKFIEQLVDGDYISEKSKKKK